MAHRNKGPPSFALFRREENGSVAGFEGEDLRLETFHISNINFRESHDREEIAWRSEARRGSVEDETTGASWGGNDIGFESTASGQVRAEYFFVVKKAALAHEIGVNTEASFVVEARFRDASAMDFRFQQMDSHIKTRVDGVERPFYRNRSS